jgi:predicted dehydrogenase
VTVNSVLPGPTLTASVEKFIAIAAAKNKKHVLAEKTFASLASVQRIVEETTKSGVAFMDATHFPHHPRTKKLQSMRDDISRR